MANILAPFGFADSRRLGAAPNYQLSYRLIKSTNTTPIYYGDPVQIETGTTGTSDGYIKQAVPAATLAVTSLSWTTGIMTITFTATTAPPVGSTLTFGTMSTATTLSGSTQGPILSSTTTTATFAFPVTQSTDTGTATVWSPIAGIFNGVEYNSISQRKVVWSPWWPGTSDATGDSQARIIDDPQMVFRVQGNAQITQAMVGMNASFVIGTGSSITFKSGATLDAAGINIAPAPVSYLPFRIVSLISSPPGANGSDTTSAYNWAEVAFNNQDYRGLVGL